MDICGSKCGWFVVRCVVDSARAGPERTARRIILADARVVIGTSIKSRTGLVMFTYELFIPVSEYKKYCALSRFVKSKEKSQCCSYSTNQART